MTSLRSRQSSVTSFTHKFLSFYGVNKPALKTFFPDSEVMAINNVQSFVSHNILRSM